MPPNVTELSTHKPETHRLDDLRVALHGQGFAQREVRENLALSYPDPVPGYFNIGILHTSAEGQEGHETYAPCRVDELVQKGYDYWALGHIHNRQILHEHPFVVFPGNVQGRHIRETGDKGCTLVTVDGSNVVLEHHTLDVLRWYVCDVDLTGAQTDVDVMASVCAKIERLVEENPAYPLALRVRFVGETELHGRLLQQMEKYRSEVQNAALMTAPDLIWIEKVKFETEPIKETPTVIYHSDAVSTLVQSIESAMTDEAFLNEFFQHVKQVQNRMGGALKVGDPTWIESSADVEPLLKDAETILLTFLGKGAI